MNDDIIRYIHSYLRKCTTCNQYHIHNNLNDCSICKDSYCETCTIQLNKFYGFYENKICNECNSFYR